MAKDYRILIVEDNPVDYRLIERELTKSGLNAECERVETLTSLHTALGRDDWNVLLTDFRIPGLEFETILYSVQSRCPDLPIILVSGSIGEEKAVELLKLGVSDFVLKDNLTRLVPSIRRSLREVADRRSRHETEIALRESEANYRILVDNLPQVVWHKNHESRYVACNARFALSVGFPVGDVPGKTDFDFYPPDLALKYRRDDHRVYSNGVEETYEERWIDRGRERFVRTTKVPLRNRDDTVYGILGIAEDITERRQAEHQLRLAAAVFSSSQEGVIVTAVDGTILAVNPAARVITGYGEDELLGGNMRMVKSERHPESFYRQMFETVASEGYWQGEIWNRRKNGDIYPGWLTISCVRDENDNLTNYVGSFVDITRIKQSETQLEHLAHHDPLTDLPNRLLLLSRLDHAIACTRRDRGMGAILFLDLDRFKNVNDSFGHPCGDYLLRMVAERLASRVRKTDTLARLGGDEFAVLLEHLPDPQHAAYVAQALIDQMKEPFILDSGQEIYIGTSVGISVFPDDGDTSSQIIRNADAALYQAKGNGRATFRFYTEAMSRAANARIELEARLRRAMNRREFLLHYQPLVSLEDHRINGVEALLRWNHPSEGMILPGRFIPLAEETGLIVPLGAWVLRAACAQMIAWLDAGVSLSVVAVNLSPVQFRQPNIVDTIRSTLQETGLAAEHLELEITEGTLLDSDADIDVKLAALKTLGVKLSIDDFGTGYSSLAYLKKLPIDKLKIDRGFVADIPFDPADMEITAAVVGLARNLRLEVLAEGVETESQLSFLRQLGCHSAQGYLFSPPVPESEIRHLLERAASPCDSAPSGDGPSPSEVGEGSISENPAA